MYRVTILLLLSFSLFSAPFETKTIYAEQRQALPAPALDKTATTKSEKSIKKSTFKIKYTTERVNFRAAASLKSDVKDVLDINTKVKVYIDKGKNDFCYCLINDDEYGYIYSDYLSDDKMNIPDPIYEAHEFRTLGVVYYNNYRWTWYSQNVLPGGGLNIPGRHIDYNGFVCDEDDYICLASGKLNKGAVISTPFGKYGKVYDYCETWGTIDTYCAW